MYLIKEIQNTMQQNPTDQKEKTSLSIITVEDFKTHLSVADRQVDRKISQNIKDLNIIN